MSKFISFSQPLTEIFKLRSDTDPSSNLTNYIENGIDISITFLKKNNSSQPAANTGFIVGTSDLSQLFEPLINVDVGTIIIWSGQISNVPSGYLLCDGSFHTSNEYSDLFSVIGNTYGGDTNNFNVPNFNNYKRGYMNNTYQTYQTYEGGNNNITLKDTPSHTHTITNILSHKYDHVHNVNNDLIFAISWHPSIVAEFSDTNASDKASSNYDHNTFVIYCNKDTNGIGGGSVSGSFSQYGNINDAGTPIEILNPYISIFYIIKY
jgi:microcystin-dependent protein